MGRARHACTVVVVLALASVGLSAAAGDARAEPEHDFVVTLFIDRGVAWNGRVNETSRWTDEHERVEIEWENGIDETVSVYIHGDRVGDDDPGAVEFTPGDGRALRPGRYVDPGWRGDGQPAVGVENAPVCSPGRFTVLDVDPDQDRLWMIFESHCSETRASVFGEIRVNVPSSDEGLELSPSRVLWPDLYRKERGRPVDVRLTNTGPTPQALGPSRIAGDDSFRVLDDDCALLAPGQSCTVRTSFRPRRSGRHDGAVTVPREGGPALSVPLEARGEPGFTQLRLRGSGLNRVLDRDETVDPRRVYLSIAPTNRLGDDVLLLEDVGLAVRTPGYRGYFGSRDGDSLGLGRHKNAGFVDNGPNTHRCDEARGNYTVREIRFDVHGNLRRLRLEFRQVCLPDRRSVLHGAIAWRARDPIELPPRVKVTVGRNPIEATWRRVRLRLERGAAPRRVALIGQNPNRPRETRIVDRLRLRPGVRVERKVDPRGYEAFFAFAGGRRPVVSDARLRR